MNWQRILIGGVKNPPIQAVWNILLICIMQPGPINGMIVGMVDALEQISLGISASNGRSLSRHCLTERCLLEIQISKGGSNER